MSDSFSYRITVDSSGAVEGASDLAEAFEEAEDAGKKLDGLEVAVDVDAESAAEATEEIEETGEAADEVDGTKATVDVAAEGAPEAVEQIGDVDTALDGVDGRDVQAEVSAIFGDTRQALDELKDDLGVIDDTDVSPEVDLSGLDDAAIKAGDARTALGGIAGEALENIPALDDALGGLGGNLAGVAEEAIAGGTNIAALAASGGALAAVSIAAKAISDHFADIAATKAFNAADAKAFADALTDGATSAGVLADELRETGEIKFRLFDKDQDVTGSLQALGLEVSDFDRIMRSGEDGIEAWGKAARDAGADAGSVGVVMFAAEQRGKNYVAGQEAMIRVEEVLGDEFANTAEAALEQGEATDIMTEAILGSNDAALASIEAQQAMADARRAAADAAFAARDAQRDFDAALAENTAAIAENNVMSAENAERLDETAQSAGRLADAEVTLAADQAKANGTTQSASQAQRTWNTSMLASARSAEGPLRQAIIDYIAEVNGIPPEKVSEILADTDYASIAEAAGALDGVAHPREALVKVGTSGVSAADSDINSAARDRETTIRVHVKGVGRSAVGSFIPQPEGLSAPAAANGLLGAPAAQPGASSATAVPFVVRVEQPRLPTPTINIHAAVIGNRFDVSRTVATSLRRYERLNGRRRP